MGGVAMVTKGGNEPPCLAPKGDWRKFIRRNLGEGEAPRPPPLVKAPVAARPVVDVPPPPPPPILEPEPPPPVASPLADSVHPAEEAMPPPPPPRTHWESIDDEPPRDEVVPPHPPS